MKILLIESIKFFTKWAEHNTGWYFKIRALSLMQLAAIFPDDDVIIRDGYNDKHSPKMLAKILLKYNDPNYVIGISSHSSRNARNSFYTLKLVKSYAPKATVIMGGYHGTFYHQKWIRAGADVVIRQEGEISFSTIVNKLKKVQKGEAKLVKEDMLGTTYSDEWFRRINGEDIPNIFVKNYCLTDPKKWKEIYKVPLFFSNRKSIVEPDRPFAKTLDQFPFPDRTKLNHSKGLFFPLLGRGYFSSLEGSRGCPFSCKFCSSKKMWKQHVRFKSAERLIEEVKECLKLNIRKFIFIDESWGVNSKQAWGFINGLKREKLDISWNIQIRADTIVENPDMIVEAGKWGCNTAMIGFETLNQEINDMCNKKSKLSHYLKAKRILEKAGIMSFSYFLCGLPHETRKSWRTTLRMVRTLAEVGIMQPFIPYFEGTFEGGFKTPDAKRDLTQRKFSLHDFSNDRQLPKRTKILNRDMLTYLLMFIIDPRNLWRAWFARTKLQRTHRLLIRYFYMQLIREVFNFKAKNFLNLVRGLQAPLDA